MTDPTTTSDAHATAAHEAGATDAVAAHDAPVQAAHAAAEAHASGQPALPSRASDETPVIAAEHVWKRFAVNEYRPSLRHEAFSLFRSFFRRDEPTGEPFWALKDITFAVYRGESVGIIGHNGAGKSTLFRVLCGISEPTRGEVRVQGRFAPLIALTAGFNMELSGRQNIYLNCAIQGLSRRQTDALIPNILAFADIGAFIDLPVKRYSSGMVTRLGFSVAVHTLPDIVFIDEVLSVGDAMFQAKCRTKMRELMDEGRTMLFVSHSTSEVRRICRRVIWLDHGVIRMDGPSNEVVDAFEEAYGVANSRAKASVEEADDARIIAEASAG